MPLGLRPLLPAPTRLRALHHSLWRVSSLWPCVPCRRSAAHTSARIAGQAGQQQDAAKPSPVEQTTGSGSTPAPAPAGAADGMDGEAFTELVRGTGLLGSDGPQDDEAYRQRGSFHLPRSPQPMPVGSDQALGMSAMGPWGSGLGSYGPLAPQSGEGNFDGRGNGVPAHSTEGGRATMDGNGLANGGLPVAASGGSGDPSGSEGPTLDADGKDMTPAMRAVQGLGQPHTMPINPGPPIQLFQHAQGPPLCNLFVFHIPNDMANKDLFNLFSTYGHVISARIMVDKQTGLTRGFGFVSYDNREAAEAAIRHLDRFRVGHKRLSVSHKKPRGESGPRGRRFFGGAPAGAGMHGPPGYGPPRGYYGAPPGGMPMPMMGPGGYDMPPFAYSPGPMMPHPGMSGTDHAMYARGGGGGYGYPPHGYGMPPRMPYHDMYAMGGSPYGGAHGPMSGAVPSGSDLLVGQARPGTPTSAGMPPSSVAFGSQGPGYDGSRGPQSGEGAPGLLSGGGAEADATAVALTGMDMSGGQGASA